MATLTWDQVGERFYQTGIERGVLYLQDGTVAVWNGLTGVEETANQELKSFYFDGVKYLNNLIPGDFSGKLRAFTYPDEFDLVNGIATVASGLSYYDQPPKSFNLSYRTKIGNDLQGDTYGYKIHFLYNLVAVPDTFVFDTLKKDSLLPIEFSWTLSGTPPVITGYKPTVHISIDSMDTSSDVLQAIEDILYGTAQTDPRFPSIDEIKSIFGALGELLIVDNGDGTWTAIDMAGDYITMVDSTTFRIDNANATYLNLTTYQISSTIPD